MSGKTRGSVPVYTKKAIEGNRTSVFVPAGDFIEGEVNGSVTEQDDTGVFLQVSDGRYVNVADTDLKVTAA